MRATLILTLLLINFSVFAADSEGKHVTDAPLSMRKQAYKHFIGQILGTGTTALVPSFSLSLSDNPSLSWALPIYPFESSFGAYKTITTDSNDNEWKEMSRGLFFSFSGKIASSNGYTAIVSKSQWTPDAKIGISATYIFHPGVKFYSVEVNRGTQSQNNPYKLKYIDTITNMPIDQASQVNFLWANINIGYARKSNSIYSNLRPNSDPVFDSAANGLYVATDIDWYFSPSRFKTPFLNFYVQAGITYDMRTNNSDALKQGKYESYASLNNQNGTLLVKTKEFNAYDSSAFKVGHVVNIPIQASIIFNTRDQKFYIGIGPVFNAKLISEREFGKKSSMDAGFAVSIPVSSGKGDGAKTLVNFSLKCLWTDVGLANRDATKTTIQQYKKDNFKVGFTIAAPLMLSHKRKR